MSFLTYIGSLIVTFVLAAAGVAGVSTNIMHPVGSGDQVVNASFSGAASDLTGTTLASNVVTSSLTSVGTLGSLTVTGNASSGSASTTQFTAAGTSWLNGVLAGATAVQADFAKALAIFSQANTGETHPYVIGVASEAAADGTDVAVGVYGAGLTSSAKNAYGLQGDGGVSATGDTTTATGIFGYATDTHAGGPNIGLRGSATGGATNWSLYLDAGNIKTVLAAVWDLIDNTAAALSFDSTGKTGILNVSTVNGAEGVTMSGTLGVTGQTTLGNASSTILTNTTSTYLSTVSGSTGVGTTTPDDMLEVRSNSASKATLATYNNAGTNTFKVGDAGNFLVLATQPATTTAMTLDWDGTPNQVEYRIGTAATTITLIDATTTAMWGSRKAVWVCNPGGTAGALTWVGVEWIGTAPTQTTTANQCDVYSFNITHATSTTAYKVAGAMGAGFQ